MGQAAPVVADFPNSFATEPSFRLSRKTAAKRKEKFFLIFLSDLGTQGSVPEFVRWANKQL
jgi:hypothetical protein